MDEKIVPHLEESNRELGDLEKTDIHAEFNKRLSFRMQQDVAKKSRFSKLGGKTKVLKVKDLSANLKNFEIIGSIQDLGEKTIRPQDGTKEGTSKIYNGILADETGSVIFSSWKYLPGSIGDIVTIKNAYMRTWQNKVRLFIGKQSLVSKIADPSLITLSKLPESQSKKLLDIGAADFSVGTVACVLQLSNKEMRVRGRQSEVVSGVLADETGRLPFTSWIELSGIDIGSIIRIEGAQIRMFRGMLSVNILNSTKVSSIELEEARKLAFTFESAGKDPAPIRIEGIVSKGIMFDVITAGNVISVRPGSGIISRCPECGRAIQKARCRVHGNVEGLRDMRIKAILDDGTGSISVMFPRELSESIYGKTLEEAEKLMFSNVSKDAVYEDLRYSLTGRYIAVRGNSSKGEYGISFVAEKVWVPEDDLLVRIVELLHRIGPGEGDGHDRNSQASSGRVGFA